MRARPRPSHLQASSDIDPRFRSPHSWRDVAPSLDRVRPFSNIAFANPLAWLKLIGIGILLLGRGCIAVANVEDLHECSTREMLRSTLSTLLEDEMGETFPELADDQDLRESLNLDSVDVVGLVMRIEREFRIRLATEELASVKHVGDLLDLMETKLAANPNNPTTTPQPEGPDAESS